MTNSAVLLDREMKCLTNELGLIENEQFVYLLLSEPFIIPNSERIIFLQA